MITNLKLRNFQSHKKTNLEFDKGVNIIIGPSDSGKTAIIRALRWLIWNRPLGNEFRSNWCDKKDECSVTITISNDIEIIREETPEKQYKLNTFDNPFKAFGTEVPQEIQDALQLNEINLQSQLDSPFLLSASAGDIAKHFNQIAGLDKIDSSLQNIQRWIKEITKEIDFKTQQIEQNEQKLNEFNHLEVFEENVIYLEQLQKSAEQKEKDSKSLQKLLSQIETTVTDIEEKSKILVVESFLITILSKIEEKQQIETNRKKLRTLVQSININISNKESNEKLISCGKTIDSLLDLYKSKQNISLNKDRLKKLLTNINSNITELSEAKINYQKLHKEFDNNIGDICIFCNQTIKK